MHHLCIWIGEHPGKWRYSRGPLTHEASLCWCLCGLSLKSDTYISSLEVWLWGADAVSLEIRLWGFMSLTEMWVRLSCSPFQLSEFREKVRLSVPPWTLKMYVSWDLCRSSVHGQCLRGIHLFPSFCCIDSCCSIWWSKAWSIRWQRKTPACAGNHHKLCPSPRLTIRILRVELRTELQSTILDYCDSCTMVYALHQTN